MRLFPIITAVLVVIVLFFGILQRDALINFANTFGAEDSTETVDETPVAVAETEASADPETPEANLVHVLVRQSKAQPVANAVLVRGQTEAKRQVNVQAETSGTVISDPLRKGSFVETGQLLCQLDPGTRAANLLEAQARLAEAEARLPEAQARVPEAAARLAEAEARLEEAKINVNAARQLSEGGFASETRVANAEASLRAAQAGVVAAETGLESTQAGIEAVDAAVESASAAVLRAQDDLDKLDITAPFAGLLESDTAELGALLQPGALCATVIQLDPIKLVGFVGERDVDKITLGARGGARLLSGQEVAGEVSFLSRSADDLTRTFRVEIDVPNSELAIRDGQTVEMLIEAAGERAHLLPASALTLNDTGQIGVRTVEDGIVAFAQVTLLRDTTQGVWLKGLPDAVDVILVGQEYVTDGVPVQVTYEELSQ